MRRKFEKGITLIALVITIIILVIIAGVSINLLLGNKGIINKAKESQEKQTYAQIKEDIELTLAYLQIEYQTSNVESNSFQEWWLSKLDNGGIIETNQKAILTKDEIVVVYTAKDGKEYDIQINENGKIEVIGESTGDRKYAILTYNLNGGKDGPKGKLYSHNTEVEVDFTTKPIKVSYNFLGWAEEENATEAIYTEEGTKTFRIGEENKTLYAVWSFDQVYASEHPELHIPTGFTHTIGTWDTGYVIQDAVGNEFVWIPVSGTGTGEYKKTMGSKDTYMTSAKQSQATQVALSSIKGDKLGVTNILGKTVINDVSADRPEASIVNAAGGFWVGRYEAGIENKERSTQLAGMSTYYADDTTNLNKSNAFWEEKRISNSILVQSNKEPVRQITQTQALKIANSWGSGSAGNNTVAWQSGLITGTEWDLMCQFIGWSTCDTDCGEWGNYYNISSKTYTDLYHSTNLNSNWLHTTTSTLKPASSTAGGWVFPTGMFETTSNGTAKKNLYDVAGNVLEWTTEIVAYDNSHAVQRSGCANADSNTAYATLRLGNTPASSYTYFSNGFRIVIYVD